MAVLLLGWPIYSDVTDYATPVLAGGSWSASLPLANLQDRRLALVARSANAAITSTVITADLGSARAVRLVGIPKHTLSTAARWRVRGNGAVLANVAANPQTPNSWTSINTPLITTGQTDPWGGTSAILVEDNDAALSEGKYTTLAFTGDGEKIFHVAVRAGTLATIRVDVFDNSVSAIRHGLLVTWQGGTTAPAVTWTAGAGTIYDSLPSYDADGTLWWIVRFSATAIIAANANWLRTLGGTVGGHTGTYYLAGAEAYNQATPPYDSGIVAAWPSGLTLEEADGINVGTVLALSSAETYRYWQVNLIDPTNADGYVDLARLVIAGGYEPEHNMSVGARLGWESQTTVSETDGGARLFDEKPRRRVWQFSLDQILEEELIGTVFDLQRRLGTSGQLYAVYDLDDTTHLHRRAFLATLSALSPLVFGLTRGSVAFALTEEL